MGIKNDHTVRVRGGWGPVVAALAIVSVSFFAISQAQYIVARVPGMAAVISSVLVELTNADRASNGLAILSLNPTLTAVAEAKAHDMAAKGYFAHTSPEGLTPWHWFAEEKYRFLYAGENLAIDFTESAAVEQAWMNSPTHRANIVGTQFTEMGVAVATGTYQGRETVFVVQVFGTPAPHAFPAEEPALQAGAVDKEGKEVLPQSVPEVRELPIRDSDVPIRVATSLPESAAAPTAESVLGNSAGAYLATAPQIPWWFRVLRSFF